MQCPCQQYFFVFRIISKREMLVPKDHIFTGFDFYFDTYTYFYSILTHFHARW